MSAFGRLLVLCSLPTGLELVGEGARLVVHEERIVHAEPPPQGLGIWVLPGQRAAGFAAV